MTELRRLTLGRVQQQQKETLDEALAVSRTENEGIGYAAVPRCASGLTLPLPPTFLWGSAIAAKQNEGGGVLDDFYPLEVGGAIEASGLITDFWNRYEEDFDIAQSLGHTAIRLSIEWSRVETSLGVYDAAALDHYKTILDAAHARGLQTFVTLQHFTIPQWLANIGGLLNPGVITLFGNYVTAVTTALTSTRVDYWLTVNEPNVLATNKYLTGIWPPNVVLNAPFAVGALVNLLKMHAAGYAAIHALIPAAKVGFAHNMAAYSPLDPLNPFDVGTAAGIHTFWNESLLDAATTGNIVFALPSGVYVENYPALANTMDFVGVNYYTRFYVKYEPLSPAGFSLSSTTDPRAVVSDVAGPADFVEEVYPQGFYDMLTLAGTYSLPIYVTENGIADADDSRRGKFIMEHVRMITKAIDAAVADVQGYLHWTLTDNWEWHLGTALKYGLVQVDFSRSALTRSIRPSALLLKGLMQGLTVTV